MPGPLEWQFGIDDKLSRASKGMSASLGDLQKSIGKTRSDLDKLPGSLKKSGDGADKAAKSAKGLTLEWGNMFKSFGGLREASEGWVFNLSEGLTSVIGLASSLYDGVNKVIEIAKNNENLDISFNTHLGTKGAKELDDYANKLDKLELGYTGLQIKQFQQPLVRQNIPTKDIENYTPLALGVAHREGSDKEGVEAALAAFGHVRTKHQIGSADLEALGIGGANEQKTVVELLQRLKLSSGAAKSGIESPDEALSRISYLASHGRIKSEKLDQAVRKLVAEQEPGGVAGTSALLHKATHAPDAQGLARIAQELNKVKVSAYDWAADVASDATKDPNKLGNRVLDFSKDAAQQLGQDTGLGSLFGGSSGVTEKSQYEQGVKLGTPLPTGYAEAIQAGIPQANQSTADLAGQSTDTAKTKLKIHSPSKVFQEIGEQTIAGFALGLSTGKSAVDGNMSKVFSDAADAASGVKPDKIMSKAVESSGAGSPSPGSSGGGGGRPIINHFTFSIQGDGASPSEIANEVMQRIEEKFPTSALLSPMEQLAASFGAQ